MALKTNYKEDILDTSVNLKRKYTEVVNPDGTKSFDDSTVYTQEGDPFGAADINQTNAEVNRINNDLTANSNHFYFDYKDGKYGYNTDPNRGADTFAPFKNGLMPNISLGNMNCYLNFQEDENITYVKFQLTILSGNYGRVMVN